MSLDCIGISNHEPTNSTYLFYGSVKGFKAPMGIKGVEVLIALCCGWFSNFSDCQIPRK